jgi:SAM-dependent methyltransferase
VLDVGAGAGAASRSLVARASALYAVDQDAELLDALVREAGADRIKVTTIVGGWPQVAPGVPIADVVVCHHVLYNVPDLRPFVKALSAHARRRVVIEITAQHPLSRLNPLWKRFHALDRPIRPTWEDAARAIRSLREDVHVERERVKADVLADSWEELVGFTCRRLCLGSDRLADVGAALTEQGARPGDPSTWSTPDREVVTLWWDAG